MASCSGRRETQQMGFGTVQPFALRQYLTELQDRQLISMKELFLDIGAGIGNVLQDVCPLFPVWGVEMNTSFIHQTPAFWKSSIVWCKLEETRDSRLSETTIAYMYDLCLKRLSRRTKILTDDPHWCIQNILLDSHRMPSLKYFLSTYEENCMHVRHGNCWKLVDKKKLPCSTDSYTFYLYERVPVSPPRTSKKRALKTTTKRIKKKRTYKKRRKTPQRVVSGGNGDGNVEVEDVDALNSIPFATVFDEGDDTTTEADYLMDTLSTLSSSAEIELGSSDASTNDTISLQSNPSIINTTTQPAEEFVIERIEKMKGNPSKNSKKLLFFVHWAGFNAPTWEPYDNIKRTYAFYTFINKTLKAHYKLLPRNIIYQEEECDEESANRNYFSVK